LPLQVLGIWPIELLLVAGALGFPWLILTSPLAIYRGYVLPHKFGLSTQSFVAWGIDQLKSYLLGGIMGGMILIGLYSLLRFSPDRWWLPAGVSYSLFSIVLTILTPVVFMPIFLKSTPLSEDYASLKSRLLELAERTGTRVEGIFSIDLSRRTRAANAALAGLGKTRRILLGDTLLENFTEDEIEVVMAHEFAHHLHRDIPIGILLQSILNLVMFLLTSFALERYLSAFDLDLPGNPAGLPMLLLAFIFFGFLTMPLGNAFSRWRERMADRFALEATGKPRAFIDAMTRLANQNLAELDPEPWIVFLLYSHPPLSERIASAESFQPSTGPLA
jgi:STE24 endopeptidase